MLKKWLHSLLQGKSSSQPYRKFSSSDYARRKHSQPQQPYGHAHYGRSHYKKKQSSRSFFSS